MEKLLEYREKTARISFPGIRMDRNNAKRTMLRHAEKHPGTIKVAESDGNPAGYIMFQPKKGSLGPYGHINTIFVEKTYRNRGVGALLLKEAEKRLRKKGLRRMNATVTATNRRSLDFFGEHGYRKTRIVVEKSV